MVSRAGEDVAVEFGPHGLEFNRMVQVRIYLDNLENRYELMSAAKMAFYNDGQLDENRITVLSGLKPGERLLVSGDEQR